MELAEKSPWRWRDRNEGNLVWGRTVHSPQQQHKQQRSQRNDHQR